uniref:Uncharacterized protein n=1 Tax=Anguilla anguilla TaxID=7936 RepID=A0A0E9QNI9_ANGAN
MVACCSSVMQISGPRSSSRRSWKGCTSATFSGSTRAA